MAKKKKEPVEFDGVLEREPPFDRTLEEKRKSQENIRFRQLKREGKIEESDDTS